MELQQTLEVSDPHEVAVLYRDGDVVRHKNVHGILFEENELPLILGNLEVGNENVKTYLVSIQTIDETGRIDGMIVLDLSVVRGARSGSGVRLIEKKEDGTFEERTPISLFS